MKKLTIALSLAMAFALPVFAEDPCLQTDPLDPAASGAQSWNGTKGSEVLGNRGTDDAYGVEAWANSGGDKTKLIWFGPNQGGGFAFRAEWTDSDDYLGRFGYFWGIDGKKWDRLGDLCVDYNYKRSKNGSGGSYSYIGVYGWTISSGGNGVEAEYYIVEDWFGENQQGANNLGNGCQTHSDITVDGKTYQVVTCVRPENSGCITCNNKSFGQVFSIRQGMRNPEPPKCGTISIKKHFEEWIKQTTEKGGQSPAKYIYDKTYESKFLAEAQGGTGWFEASFLKFSRTGNCGFDIPPGNYTLNLAVSPSEGGNVSRTPVASYYSSGSSVSLTATPASGWKFDSWSGDATGTANPLSVTMNANKSITAKFTPVIDPNKNLVTNGTFTNTDGWTFNKGSSYGNSDGTFTVANNKATINISTTGSNPWEPQLVQNGITLVEGMTYRLTFDASAASNRKIGVVIQMAGGDYDTYFEKEIDLTSATQTFIYEFKMDSLSDESGRIGFNLGQATGTVTISNVKLNYVETSETSSSSGNTGNTSSSSSSGNTGNTSSSSSTTGGAGNCAYESSWCGGNAFTSNSSTKPTTGQCVFVSDYTALTITGGGGTVLINGTTCTGGNANCVTNKPPAADGGYYIYVQTGTLSGSQPYTVTPGSPNCGEDTEPILQNRIPATHFSVQTLSDKALRIEINSPSVVEIFDLRGNKVEKFDVSSTSQTVKLSLPNGVYFAKVRGMKSVRFVLK